MIRGKGGQVLKSFLDRSGDLSASSCLVRLVRRSYREVSYQERTEIYSKNSRCERSTFRAFSTRADRYGTGERPWNDPSRGQGYLRV